VQASFFDPLQQFATHPGLVMAAVRDEDIVVESCLLALLLHSPSLLWHSQAMQVKLVRGIGGGWLEDTVVYWHFRKTV
jgi:hypothetical protein